MTVYSLRQRSKKTSESQDTVETSSAATQWEKQNQAVAQIRKKDLNTWYYACSCCPRILLSKQKRRFHEIRVHGKYPRIPVPIRQHKIHIKPIPIVAHVNVATPPAQPKPRNVLKPVSIATVVVPQPKPRLILKPVPQQHRGLGNNGGIYTCQHCKSKFTSPWNLKVHLQTIHDNVRPFPCNVCGKRFKQRIHLLGHFISTHSKVKAFRCDLCSFGFVKKWNLFDHARKHHQATQADLNRLKLRYSKRRLSNEKDD